MPRYLVEPNAETAAAVATRRWAAYLRMLDRDVEDAIREGGIAMAIAERLADEESVVHCLNTIGSSMIVAGRVEEGREHLERSRAMAERHIDRERGLKENRRETQGILDGGEAGRVPAHKVTLFLLRTAASRNAYSAWWPQVRFPDGQYAFAFAV